MLWVKKTTGSTFFSSFGTAAVGDSLKAGIGKLELNNVSSEQLPDVAEESGLVILPIKADVAASFHQLPNTGHKDPFDRMLVWQAINGKMTLVTKERFPEEYKRAGLKVIW